jgi:heme exporter protein B
MLSLLIKDLKVELRRKFELLASLSFVLVSSLMIAQASHLTTKDLLMPSFFIVVVFIAVFTSTTSFVREMDSKTINALKLAPISSQVIFLSKSVFSFVSIFFQGFLELLFLSVFSNDFSLFTAIPVFVVFSFYIAVVSAFSSALVMYSEGRAFLTPMLVFTFTAPIVMPLMRSDVTVLALETVAVTSAVTTLSAYVLND